MARILIVDDNHEILDILTILLNRSGHEVIGYDRGDEAVALLKSSEKIDAVISDIYMQPIDGFEVLEAAKSLRPALPVLFLTGHMNPELEEKASSLGIYAYITKPPSLKDLMSTVDRAVHENRPQHEAASEERAPVDPPAAALMSWLRGAPASGV